MICPNCGAENAQGAPYCYNCANPLPQAATPPGSVPPGSVPPGSTPPPPAGPGQTAQFPQQGAVPPGSVPPGGGAPPQWPGGGGFEPPKTPKSTISAGLGGLIAFLVVAGIGAILFFTVFNKKDKVEPVPPTGPIPSPTISIPPTSVPPTSVPPTSTPPTSVPTSGATTGPTTAPTTAPTTGATTAATSGPTTTGGNDGGDFRNVVRLFFCKKVIPAPTGCHNPTVEPLLQPHNIPSFNIMVLAIDFEPGATIAAKVGLEGTRITVAQGQFTTTGQPGVQRAFLPIIAPEGGFPPVTLVVVVTVNGQPLQFANGNGDVIVPRVRFI